MNAKKDNEKLRIYNYSYRNKKRRHKESNKTAKIRQILFEDKFKEIYKIHIIVKVELNILVFEIKNILKKITQNIYNNKNY